MSESEGAIVGPCVIIVNADGQQLRCEGYKATEISQDIWEGPATDKGYRTFEAGPDIHLTLRKAEEEPMSEEPQDDEHYGACDEARDIEDGRTFDANDLKLGDVIRVNEDTVFTDTHLSRWDRFKPVGTGPVGLPGDGLLVIGIHHRWKKGEGDTGRAIMVENLISRIQGTIQADDLTGHIHSVQRPCIIFTKMLVAVPGSGEGTGAKD